MARTFIQLPQRINPVAWLVAVLLVIFLAFSIATPLRNYFEQKADLAKLNATIAKQEEDKARLTDELNRYHDQDYIKEQARTRLGLIDPGESAFRIVSPKIDSSTPGDKIGESKPADQDKQKDWYATLLDSVSKPEDATSLNGPNAKATDPNQPEDHQLPTVPGTENRKNSSTNNPGGGH